MLYTQQFTMPVSGHLRIGTIGGEPYEYPTNERGVSHQMQVGYMLPPRMGLLRVLPAGNGPEIFACTASVSGYSNRPISDVKVPADVYVELPASVVVKGPPGTEIIVEAWVLECAGPSRGCSRSGLVGLGIPVPNWAASVDIALSGVATFRNVAAAIVGVVTGTVVGFSIPDRAISVDLAGPANTSIIFRQQG